ncbi:pentapeptide repeat-containing protein [Arcobacter lacus]|uniref:pentapeptide repeat-containing protein n=1 Tax=Arcobacter lacus TaxID=1912876 RepID=UPI0021BB2415|nr:pentapeptide repeat-containing protein [Arcobacter lacus]MCT7909135.1 pentapeptide repeat-containing protein [Arcobacter lacus]
MQSNCSCINCQFDSFLSKQKNKELFYFEDKKNFDSYCIFHAPLKIKENFRFSQKEVFKTIINEYIDYCILEKLTKINFKDTIFLEYDFTNKNLEKFDIDFTNAVFKRNIRFDNLKCKELILRDTIFLDGGAIKNRGKDKNLQIKKLEFRPYSLESDFVIDLGSFSNEKGLVELDNQGVIENIKFENHKVGNGNIFFIGLNEDIKKADFRNMILDKVFFQNCNLKNCYFLNSKIDKTEFRNCYFPQNENRILNNQIIGKFESIAFLMIFPLISVILFIFIEYVLIDDSSINYLFIGMFFLFVPIYFASINLWLEIFYFFVYKLGIFIETRLANILSLAKSLKVVNIHYSIADEELIYKKLDEFYNIKDKDIFIKEKKKLQISLDSLSSSYNQLKDNFKDKDFQISGDFFYSQRYTELLSQHKKNFWDLLIFNIHHFTNGFGERYFRPLALFILTICLFIFPLNPNEDYISTSSTPLFLIKDFNEKDNSLNIYSSFRSILKINEFEKELLKEDILYGYDQRFNYHIKEQKVLDLKENNNIKLIHSFSNMIYPFTPEQKRWFQNISEKAVFLSLLESILLWYFAIAFVLALWHRIKK